MGVTRPIRLAVSPARPSFSRSSCIPLSPSPAAPRRTLSPTMPTPVAGIPPRVLEAYRARRRRGATGCAGSCSPGSAGSSRGHGTAGGATVDADHRRGRAARSSARRSTAATAPSALPVGQWPGWWGAHRAVAAGRRPDAVPPRHLRRLGGRRRRRRRRQPPRHRRRRGHRRQLPVRRPDGASPTSGPPCGATTTTTPTPTTSSPTPTSSTAEPPVGGSWLCPVAGPTSFTDTWGAPRSGGRQHQGVDMFAADRHAGRRSRRRHRRALRRQPRRTRRSASGATTATTTTAPTFAGSAPRTGHVAAGTIVGYVGDTGNAAGTPPHLHFEIHPGRRRGDARRASTRRRPSATALRRMNRLGFGILRRG